MARPSDTSVEAMLEYEFGQLAASLGRARGETAFFAFADTAATAARHRELKPDERDS